MSKPKYRHEMFRSYEDMLTVANARADEWELHSWQNILSYQDGIDEIHAIFSRIEESGRCDG